MYDDGRESFQELVDLPDRRPVHGAGADEMDSLKPADILATLVGAGVAKAKLGPSDLLGRPARRTADERGLTTA